MAEVDYKSLLNQAKVYLSSKYDYSKLTLAEKLSVLLSRIVIVSVALLIGFCIMLLLSGALVNVLSDATHNTTLAYVIVAGIWAIICLLFFAFKTTLIINPVTRFVTKLMFNPEEEQSK